MENLICVITSILCVELVNITQILYTQVLWAVRSS